MESGVGKGMAGTSQTTIFWAVERSLGFILLGLVNPCRIWSGKPRDLIFKRSPDLYKETKSSFPFILPLGVARRREPPKETCEDCFEPGWPCKPTPGVGQVLKPTSHF